MKMEEGLVPLTLFVYSLFILLSIFKFSSADDDLINSTQSIADGETLVSSGTSFELGFFSPIGSTNRYLGIWYRSFPQIIVWVANRERPLTDLGGVLIFSSDGNLILLNATKSVIWSSNSSRAIQNSFARLLDSGNLVLGGSRDLNAENSIWQSFDYPSDTLLPGMKLGWNFVSGQNPFLTSWKSAGDPSIGDFTYMIEIVGLTQGVARKGSEKSFRTGAWNGLRFSGISTFRQISVTDNDELIYRPASNSVISRDVLTQSGIIEHHMLSEGSTEWVVIYRTPSNMCDNYGQCGPNGICRMEGTPTCDCLKGFVPKKQSEWDVLVRSSGCVRSTPLNCHNGDGFVKLKNVKLPDLLEFSLNKSMNLKECKAECLKNCSCMAFANSDIRDGGSGCLMWFHDLIDMREFFEENSEQDMYIRMPASLLGLNDVLLYPDHKQSKKRRVLIGKLSSGQEIAVKRLSKNSGQGVEEFKNEIILISKLQHRNLVKLLACCLAGEERMLVGYMSPEYAIDGKFSVKSDVFSFGVLMIEILSGKKNNRYHHPVHYCNLLGHAWMLWNEGKALELLDPCLEDSCIESQVLRCIQIGLLCVQKFPKDRPIMPAVVSMLGNEGLKLAEPKEPGFFLERDSEEMDILSGGKSSHSKNAVTITLPEAR
ncbi:hypothetical protein LguiA_023199 [Lonicera macranthoides]